METEKPKNIDGYIARFPLSTQLLLEQIRTTIKEAAPEAEEAISYGMPTFKLKGNLVHFAGYSKHIGFYATPSGHSKFETSLSCYKQGKGSVQFPIDQPIPLDLITEIVKFRVKENLEKSQLLF